MHWTSEQLQNPKTTSMYFYQEIPGQNDVLGCFSSATMLPIIVSFDCTVVAAPKFSTRSSTQPETACGFSGNPEFYGFGIRLGIYLQWLAAILANAFLKEAVAGSLETNTVFLLALTVSTIYATSLATIRNAEVLVLLHLYFSFIFSILSLWGQRARAKLTLLGSFLGCWPL